MRNDVPHNHPWQYDAVPHGRTQSGSATWQSEAETRCPLGATFGAFGIIGVGGRMENFVLRRCLEKDAAIFVGDVAQAHVGKAMIG
jgi:hypothetical protein